MSAQNQINLSDKSTVELKAFAYDLKAVIEQYTQLFQVVNQEIANRAQNAKTEQPEVAVNNTAEKPEVSAKPKQAKVRSIPSKPKE